MHFRLDFTTMHIHYTANSFSDSETTLYVSRRHGEAYA